MITNLKNEHMSADIEVLKQLCDETITEFSSDNSWINNIPIEFKHKRLLLMKELLDTLRLRF